MPLSAPLSAKTPTMKTTKILILLSLILAFSSCGDDDPIVIPKNTPSIADDTSANANKNTTGPVEAQTNYEFPRLKGGTSDVIIHKTEDYGITYSLEWDHNRKAQRWSCWEMNGSNKQEKYSRKGLWGDDDPWAYDPLVPQNEQQATYNELSNSYWPNSEHIHNNIYQKGHVCASQDRIYDKEANRQTFYMTNILPMVGNFNSKIWAKLEKQVRTWGNKSNTTLYICKGGTIDDANILDYTIGGHIVPKYFFMAILSNSANGLSAIGFLLEHLNEDRSYDPLSKYACTVDELEKFTGIDFFCNLPDNTENKIEATLTLSDWNLQ